MDQYWHHLKPALNRLCPAQLVTVGKVSNGANAAGNAKKNQHKQ
jgi:hypothetical protein